MALLCNILPASVKPIRQLIADGFAQNLAVTILPEYDAREQLAENLRRLMDAHPDMDTPAKLAKRCYWPSGNKKGKRVSARMIRYVLDRSDPEDSHSPTLDLIVAIGTAFGVPAWQLIVDDKQLRQWMVGKLFTKSEAVSDEKVEKHLPLPPTTTKRHGKRA